jgi:LVIVD repeat
MVIALKTCFMRPIIFAFLTATLIFSSCVSRNSGTLPSEVEGYSPIYATDASVFKQIQAGPARTTINGGKIYTVGNLLFQVEQDSGIHIISYANPSSPQKLGFIKSFLCKELAVKNGFIYTNNFSDLVVIDINNPGNIHEVSRTPDVFPDLSLQYPPKTSANQFEKIYFECPDPKKGVIVAWKKQTINNPKCWR